MNGSSGCGCNMCGGKCGKNYENTSNAIKNGFDKFISVFSEFFIYILIAIIFVWFVYPFAKVTSKRGSKITGG